MKELNKLFIALGGLLLVCVFVFAGYQAGTSNTSEAPAKQLAAMNATTSADAIADGIALSASLRLYEDWKKALGNTAYRDIRSSHSDETMVMLKNLYSVRVKTVRGKAVQSFISVALMYDRMGCNMTINAIAGGTFLTAKKDINECLGNAQLALDLSKIFYGELITGKTNFGE